NVVILLRGRRGVEQIKGPAATPRRTSADESLDVDDQLGLQRRDSNRHRQCHHAVDPAYRALLGWLAIAGIVDRHHPVTRTDRKDGMIPVRNLALQKNLLKIAQRRRHTLHPLAKLNEMILHELLAQTGLQQPRQKMSHVPSIKTDLRNVVVPK